MRPRPPIVTASCRKWSIELKIAEGSFAQWETINVVNPISDVSLFVGARHTHEAVLDKSCGLVRAVRKLISLYDCKNR